MIMTSKYKNFKAIDKFEEYIVVEQYHKPHHITKGKYLAPGSYVMIKQQDYFEYQNDPYYGINSKMKKLCGCILRIKKATLLKDYWRFNGDRGQYNRGAELYDLIFEKPDYLNQSTFNDIVESYNWNSEMVIPVERTGRNIKI